MNTPNRAPIPQLLRVAALSAAALAAALAPACSSSPTSQQLVILHTNDEHSHLVGEGPEADDFPAPTTAGTGSVKGGLARRAALFASERAQAKTAGADVLVVSAGDNAMGTVTQLGFTSAAPDYRSLALLGYDVTTFGNHEFDYGPGALAASIAAAKASPEGLPVIVSSNIHFSGSSSPSGDAPLGALFDESGTDPSQPIHRTWIVTTPSGIKVGFVGIMGINAASVAPLKAPVVFSTDSSGGDDDVPSALGQLCDELQPLVDGLRAGKKVDLVVALSHSGVDTVTPANGEDTQIAQCVSGIDVIVSGHTHTNYPATLVTNPKSGRQVLIQQAGRYGDHYGRIAMTVKVGADVGDLHPVTFDMTRSTTVPIDDTTVGSADAETFVSSVFGAIEDTPVAALGNISYLAYTASITAGTTLTANPAKAGSLAFAPIAASSYTIHQGALLEETPLLRLAADAMLAAAESSQGPTDLAVEAAGVLRGDIIPDKAGQISFADLFESVPLGISPSGLPGYPLTRFGIYLAEIKAAFEVTAGYAYATTNGSDDFLVPSGFCFKYDTSRPMFDSSGSALDPTNGRVTEIRIMADHTKLDACETAGTLVFSVDPAVLAESSTGYLVSPLSLYSVTTNLYVAEFAALAGVHLKDPTTGLPLASPIDAIEYAQLEPGVDVEIKEWEALGGYLRALDTAGGGALPPIYDDTQAAGSSPTRAICSGPLCK